MEYNDSECMGCLLFDDVTFCRQIYHLLKGFYRHSILEIGELDISHAPDRPEEYKATLCKIARLKKS
jgi:hypothetical protein